MICEAVLRNVWVYRGIYTCSVRPANGKDMVLRGVSVVAAFVLLGFFLVTCLPHSGHHHGKEGACSICQVGRLPFLEPSVSTAFTLLFPITWVGRAAPPGAPREILISAGSSRAPPS